MKGSVRGLTTAAGIWMTAAIGMAVGVGMYWCSIIATLMILVTLVLFEAYEQRYNMGQENRALRLSVDCIVTDISPYRKVFESQYSSLDLFSAIRLYSQYNGHQFRGTRTIPPELSADVRGFASHQSDALADTHIAGMTWSSRSASIRVKRGAPKRKNTLKFSVFSNCVRIVTCV